MLPYFKIESRTKAKVVEVVVWVVYDFCNVCLVADFPFSNPSSWSHSSSQASHVSIFRHNLLNVVYGLSRVHPCTYFVLQKACATIVWIKGYFYGHRLNLSIKYDILICPFVILDIKIYENFEKVRRITPQITLITSLIAL